MSIKEADITESNLFVPKESANLSPELACLQKIRQAYLKFPTRESLDRITTLNQAAVALKKEGLVADLLIGGSLAVGQSVDYSDIDVFGVVTEEEVKVRAVIEAYEAKLARELGRDIEFPVTADTELFTVNNLRAYLDGDYLADVTGNHRDAYTHGKIRQFYYNHYICLGIGTCRMDLLGKIEALKAEHPVVVKDLSYPYILLGLSAYFQSSFSKYTNRLSEHPDFSALLEPEKKQFLGDLGEQQYQFLFYVEYPKYCVLPSDKQQ